MKKIYVYIAGPYTTGDPVENTRRVVQTADTLIQHGFTPFVPHLSMFWHFLYPHDVDYWYQYDIDWLEKCDVLLRLSGESKGADNEVDIALKRGINVAYSLNDLLELKRSGNE